jgi:hypothetical protein
MQLLFNGFATEHHLSTTGMKRNQRKRHVHGVRCTSTAMTVNNRVYR